MSENEHRQYISSEKNTIDLDEQVSALTSILKSLGYLYHIWKDNDTTYCSIGITERKEPMRGIVLYVYGESDPLFEHDYDWIEHDLSTALLFEDVSNREDMLLEILFRYSLLHPQGYFYNESDWFYSSSDIQCIYKSGQWENWCYLKPQNR